MIWHDFKVLALWDGVTVYNFFLFVPFRALHMFPSVEFGVCRVWTSFALIHSIVVCLASFVNWSFSSCSCTQDSSPGQKCGPQDSLVNLKRTFLRDSRRLAIQVEECSLNIKILPSYLFPDPFSFWKGNKSLRRLFTWITTFDLLVRIHMDHASTFWDPKLWAFIFAVC